MFAVHFAEVVKQQALAAPEKDFSVLDICHERISYPDRRAVRWMAGKDVVQDRDRRQPSVPDDYSPCMEGSMTNTPMPFRTRVEIRHRAVINNDVAVKNVPSISGAGYFITFIDDASRHKSAIHIKSNGEAADVLKRQVCRADPQSRCTVKKIMLDAVREYAMGSKVLEVHGIEVYLTVLYTPQKIWNGQEDEPNNQNGIQTLLTQGSPRSSSWAEGLCGVCNARNRLVRPPCRRRLKKCYRISWREAECRTLAHLWQQSLGTDS